MLNYQNIRAYYELTKPRVVCLMLFTALIGMILATPNLPPYDLMLYGLLGIGFTASSAAAINHLVDHKIDAIMHRTKRRPIPQGNISMLHASIFALILGIIGIAILYIKVNTLSTILSAITLMGYACFYTIFLKHLTPQNIVIGGAAGAAPPVLGWSVISNTIAPEALLLMAIIYLWTPPHFWALAVYRQQEYKNAQIPMLSVTHGIPFTTLNILAYTLLLSLISFMPYLIQMAGIIYLVGMVVLNLIFIYYAAKLYYSNSTKDAIVTFKFSIIYLSACFMLLLIDHYAIGAML